MPVSRTTLDSLLVLGLYDQSPVNRLHDIRSGFDEAHQSTASLTLVTDFGFGTLDSRNGIHG
jgi:hypothetical protein